MVNPVIFCLSGRDRQKGFLLREVVMGLCLGLVVICGVAILAVMT